MKLGLKKPFDKNPNSPGNNAKPTVRSRPSTKFTSRRRKKSKVAARVKPDGPRTTLRRLRLKAKLSGQALANLSGVSANTIWRHERQMHHMRRLEVLNAIAVVLAKILNREVEEILKQLQNDPFRKKDSLYVQKKKQGSCHNENHQPSAE